MLAETAILAQHVIGGHPHFAFGLVTQAGPLDLHLAIRQLDAARLRSVMSDVPAGVSRSAISRKAVEASAEQLKPLQDRRWENIEVLVIYIDGQRFGAHHILSAVGVDVEGKKHILGIESERPRTPPASSSC